MLVVRSRTSAPAVMPPHGAWIRCGSREQAWSAAAIRLTMSRRRARQPPASAIRDQHLTVASQKCNLRALSPHSGRCASEEGGQGRIRRRLADRLLQTGGGPQSHQRPADQGRAVPQEPPRWRRRRQCSHTRHAAQQKTSGVASALPLRRHVRVCTQVGHQPRGMQPWASSTSYVPAPRACSRRPSERFRDATFRRQLTS